MKQAFTQYGGARPFGVSILFAGISDDGPELYVTDPTGIFFGYKATAVGELETEVREILIKEYKDGMNLDAGLKLAVRALKKVSGKDFDLDKLDGAFLNTADKTFTRMTAQDFVRLNK
jgi:proteasome alpha subunit